MGLQDARSESLALRINFDTIEEASAKLPLRE